MKSKKELTDPVNAIGNHPAIHYVVRGRKAQNEESFFERHFHHIDPIVAREQAFSFYQHYAAIMEEHKWLFSKPLPAPATFINENFGGPALQKYSSSTVNYFNPKHFDNGIAVYMVIDKPIKYMHSQDKTDDRFLIHGIWNFDSATMLSMITGLIREYGYYSQVRYDAKSYVEIVELNAYEFYGYCSISILSTPFEWKFNYYLDSKKKVIEQHNRLKLYESLIAKGTPEKAAFETRLTKQKLVRIISSFINAKGGHLFYGINDDDRKSQEVFKKVSPSVFRAEMTLLLRQKIGAASDAINISFIRVGTNVVAVFKVKPDYKKLAFIKENNVKKLYTRNQEGIVQIKDSEEIVSHYHKRSFETSTIAEILDQL